MIKHGKPKVLLIHNHYLERGGEDESFEVEKSLLSQNRHEICMYTRSNTEIESYNLFQRASLPIRTISAWDSYHDMRSLISVEKPDIAHFNNTFPLISPVAYDACCDASIPVVQNLRNYRLLCPNALFFRDHHVCEDCLERFFPWPAILHACYRDSRIQSTVVASMLAYHRLRKTWETKVDIFITLTEFSRRKFIEGGLPAEKIIVRPNFVYDHGVGDGDGDYVLFVGRLAESKGLLNILAAWKNCRSIPLKIVGDGPLLSLIQTTIEKDDLSQVELCGRLSPSAVIAMIKSARFIVFPSIWYEVFPRVLLESFSCGRPVIATNIGASSEIVDNGRTGLIVRPDDSFDMAEKVSDLWNNPDLCLEIGRDARREYEMKYTPEIAYHLLSDIYERVLISRK